VLKALGVKGDVAIGDHEYDNLFVVTLLPGAAACVRLRYGPPNALPMPKR
jgi:hypothetical protein